MRALRNHVLPASLLVITLSACSQPSPDPSGAAPPPAGPRSQPGTEMGIYTPEQHDLYQGRFLLGAGALHQVGSLSDPPGWDHIDSNAENVSPVEGTVEILDDGGLELACRLAKLYYEPEQAERTIAAWTKAGNRVLLELTPTRIRSD